MHTLYYLAAFLPVLTKLGYFLRFRKLLLKATARAGSYQEAADFRSLIATLAGFSFSALLLLIELSRESEQDYLQIVLYYLFISFISLMAAFHIEGYKFKRWQVILSTMLIEVGTLSLWLAVIFAIRFSHLDTELSGYLTIASLIIWGADHCYRFRIDYRNFKLLELKENSSPTTATAPRPNEVERPSEESPADPNLTEKRKDGGNG